MKKWAEPIGTWYNIKYTNLCTVGGLKGENRKEEKKIQEIMAENFQILWKTLTYTFKNLNKLQVGWKEWDWHWETSE